MTLIKFLAYTTPKSGEFNALTSSIITQAGLNTIRQMQDRLIEFSSGMIEGWCEAYTDSNGRGNSVDITKTTALFNVDNYQPINVSLPSSSEPAVVFEATSISDLSDFQINDCQILAFEGGGKWLVWCDTGTNAVKRAQIYKTLFYGTDGTDARVTTTYITGITSLKTNTSRDEGKKAWYRDIRVTNSDTPRNGDTTGTFSDTSTNTDSSIWARVESGGIGTNQIGTDQESNEDDNPASVKLRGASDIGEGDTYVEFPTGTTILTDTTGNTSGRASALILASGNISWSDNTSNTNIDVTIDFSADESVPTMTAVTESIDDPDNFVFEINHTIPTGTFNDTISTAIGVPLIEDWETDADIQYKLTGTSGTEDTGWLSCGVTPTISTFTAFTAEPDTLIVKLVPKAPSPTVGYPSIKGFYVRAT